MNQKINEKEIRAIIQSQERNFFTLNLLYQSETVWMVWRPCCPLGLFTFRQTNWDDWLNRAAYVTAFGLAEYFKTKWNLQSRISRKSLWVLMNHTAELSPGQMDLLWWFYDDSTNLVVSRCFQFCFIDWSSAKDILFKFNETREDLAPGAVIQSAMDGPNDNWKFLRFQEDLIANGVGTKLGFRKCRFARSLWLSSIR